MIKNYHRKNQVVGGSQQLSRIVWLIQHIHHPPTHFVGDIFRHHWRLTFGVVTLHIKGNPPDTMGIIPYLFYNFHRNHFIVSHEHIWEKSGGWGLKTINKYCMAYSIYSPSPNQVLHMHFCHCRRREFMGTFPDTMELYLIYFIIPTKIFFNIVKFILKTRVPNQ